MGEGKWNRLCEGGGPKKLGRGRGGGRGASEGGRGERRMWLLALVEEAHIHAARGSEWWYTSVHHH